MDIEDFRIAEKILLFLYSLAQTQKEININTFRRYLYLYYMTKKFLEDDNTDSIIIVVEKGNIQIANFDSILNDFESRGYIIHRDNTLMITDELKKFVSSNLNSEGHFCSQYRQINPFVNLLKSYDDQFVFTIFFSEPTFIEASKRNQTEIKPVNSRLDKLLIRFKEKIKDEQIDNYDILSHWMNFILKNYYESREETK